MKTLGLILTIAAVFFVSNLSAQRIYKLNSATGAQVKIYVTTNESEADLKVFETLQAEDVVKDGIWFQPSTESEADIKLYITSDATQADMKIIYVNTAEEAGWITREKRSFFKVNK